MVRWLTISEFPDYEISERGDVRRISPAKGGRVGKVLKGYRKPTGHKCYQLMRDGKMHHARAARLVAMTFISLSPFEGAEACHKNGDATNDYWKNIRWDTREGNRADMVRHGTRLEKGRHPSSKLSPQQVRRMKERYARGELQRDIAVRYGVQQAQVSRIVNGLRW